MKAHEHASQLERHIKQGSAADPVLKPLADVANAIKEHIGGKEEPAMDRKVAAYQRAGLLARASALSSPEAESPHAENAKTAKKEKHSAPPKHHEPFFIRLKRPFRVLGKAFVPVGAVALILVLLFSGFLPFLQNRKGAAPASIAELLIPAANAADAFTFAVEREDAAGASADTSFLLTSKIEIAPETLNGHVEIIPATATGSSALLQPIPASVAKTEGGAFRVTPSSPLEAGRVYNVRVANATIQNDDGSKQARTFSWAVQTKDAFRILSSVPDERSSGVPVNTGIEVTVNKLGWSDPAAHFKISPEAKGRFETRGRTVAFVPDKPLAYGTVYTAIFDAGWGVANSDLTLGEAKTIAFETISENRARDNREKISIQPAERFVTVAPGEANNLVVYANAETAGDVKVTGYRLSMDYAKIYLERELEIPDFAYEQRMSGKLESAFATTTAFVFTGTISVKDYQSVLALPGDIASGWYLVKLTSKDHIDSWLFLQVTNTATYVASDGTTALVWAMDAKASQPIANASVSYGDVRGTTDGTGVAKIAAPPPVSPTSTSRGVVMTIGNGSASALVRLEENRGYAPLSWRYGNNDGKTISFLRAERPLYHTTDKAEIFGFIRDRESGSPPAEPVTVELNGGDYGWWFPTETKKYASVTVTPDASGFFRTTIAWANVLPRYYSIVLKRGDRVVQSNSVEIRDYVKPAYTISVSLDTANIAAGTPFTGSVRAAFYDGTPMPSLKLRLRVSPSSAGITEIPLFTDGDGRASFSIKTTGRKCDPESDAYGACPTSSGHTFEAIPAEGEESEILGSANGTVWYVNTALRIPSASLKDGTAKIAVTAEAVDLAKLNRAGSDDPENTFGARVPSVDLSATVWKKWWEKIEDGNTYDPITKTTLPKYRYEQRSEIAQKLRTRADANGSAEFSFPTENGKSYAVNVYASDARGTWTLERTEIYGSGWNGPGERTETVEFRPRAEHENGWNGYHVGDTASYGLYAGSNPLPKTADPSYLYMTAHIGIKDVMASKDPTIDIPFTEDLVPNATLGAVVFRDHHFETYQNTLDFDRKDRTLTLIVKADKDSYAPGGAAAITVRAVDKNGKPKTDARVELSLVDEALFDATYLSTNDDPIWGIYAPVPDGIILTYASHEAAKAMMAEGGGGGGDAEAPRKNFKDTAAVLVGTTNAEGTASFTVPLPDNITSWRATAVAISPDLYAGNAQTDVAVTKDLFVNATMPGTIVQNDAPQIKLRAYGLALKVGDKVTYTVNAPTLGISDRSVDGVVGESAYLPVEHPAPGNHALTIAVKSEKGTDAIERTLSVLGSRFERDAIVHEAASTDTRLDPGLAKEIDVRFFPRTRAQYLDQLNTLRWSWIDRLESKLAKYASENILRNDFGISDIPAIDPSVFVKYQVSDGGLAILPYASSDADVSSRAAALAPDVFDAISLSGYFYGITSNEKASREEQISALAGLAALGEPVLVDLRSLAGAGDLSWRERLALARGFSSIGAEPEARAALDPLLAASKSADGRTKLDVGADESETYEATAEAAAIAAKLADPRSAQLAEWVKASWTEYAYAPIETAEFLKAAVPAAPRIDAQVVYDAGAGPQTLALEGPWPKSVRLTADEAKAFKVLSINAPIDIAYEKTVTDRPQNADGLKISRRFITHGATSTAVFKEGDDVSIELTVTIPKDAPPYGYTVRDAIPSGFIPLTKTSAMPYAENQYIASPFEGSNPTFITWAPIKAGTFTITYPVRPVMRGTYAAEPAVVQQSDLPSMTSISSEETITIQ